MNPYRAIPQGCRTVGEAAKKMGVTFGRRKYHVKSIFSRCRYAE